MALTHEPLVKQMGLRIHTTRQMGFRLAIYMHMVPIALSHEPLVKQKALRIHAAKYMSFTHPSTIYGSAPIDLSHEPWACAQALFEQLTSNLVPYE